jgi:hypothetical protein
VQRRFDDMISKFSEHYGKNDTYLDDYSCMTCHVTGFKELRVRYMNPFLFSIYASKPYGRNHDGTIRAYTKDNVALSTARPEVSQVFGHHGDNSWRDDYSCDTRLSLYNRCCSRATLCARSECCIHARLLLKLELLMLQILLLTGPSRPGSSLLALRTPTAKSSTRNPPHCNSSSSSMRTRQTTTG